MILKKQTNGNVLFYSDNNTIIASFTPNKQVLADPFFENGVRITDDSNQNQTSNGYLINFSQIDGANCQPVISATNVSELIQELSSNFFFETETGSNSSGAGENIGNANLEIDEQERNLKLNSGGDFNIKSSQDEDLLKVSDNGNFKTKKLSLIGNFATFFGSLFKISRLVAGGQPGSYMEFPMAEIAADANSMTIENGYDPNNSSQHHSMNFVNHAPNNNEEPTGGYKFYRDWVSDDKMICAIKPDHKIEHYHKSNPTYTEEGGGPSITNGYVQMATETNEVIHPTFFDSQGNAIKLMRQPLPANPTNAQIAQFLANIGLAQITE